MCTVAVVFIKICKHMLGSLRNWDGRVSVINGMRRPSGLVLNTGLDRAVETARRASTGMTWFVNDGWSNSECPAKRIITLFIHYPQVIHCILNQIFDLGNDLSPRSRGILPYSPKSVTWAEKSSMTSSNDLKLGTDCQQLFWFWFLLILSWWIELMSH